MKLNLGNCFIWILVAVFQRGAGCPTGFLSHGTDCYHFSHDMETWIGALQMCRELDSYLVEINDPAENEFIKTMAKQRNTMYWLALSDVREEGTWIWMDSHTPLVAKNFSDWNSGEPDNLHKNENCAAMYRVGHHGSWSWSDMACSTNLHYICELKAGNTELVG
ncbi:perlucin-like protein [Ruditapes philippinarum]|uniref:perlucin-like protein n=1 Tax=Ruditapes philippinarum TaxID=129788 RepID=UPI00295B8B93|nr:perlucin-like protein [Ruditapes philippinarum]